jgi:hypothetical protein
MTKIGVEMKDFQGREASESASSDGAGGRALYNIERRRPSLGLPTILMIAGLAVAASGLVVLWGWPWAG